MGGRKARYFSVTSMRVLSEGIALSGTSSVSSDPREFPCVFLKLLDRERLDICCCYCCCFPAVVEFADDLEKEVSFSGMF